MVGGSVCFCCVCGDQPFQPSHTNRSHQTHVFRSPFHPPRPQPRRPLPTPLGGAPPHTARPLGRRTVGRRAAQAGAPARQRRGRAAPPLRRAPRAVARRDAVVAQGGGAGGQGRALIHVAQRHLVAGGQRARRDEDGAHGRRARRGGAGPSCRHQAGRGRRGRRSGWRWSGGGRTQTPGERRGTRRAGRPPWPAGPRTRVRGGWTCPASRPGGGRLFLRRGWGGERGATRGGGGELLSRPPLVATPTHTTPNSPRLFSSNAPTSAPTTPSVASAPATRGAVAERTACNRAAPPLANSRMLVLSSASVPPSSPSTGGQAGTSHQAAFSAAAKGSQADGRREGSPPALAATRAAARAAKRRATLVASA